MIGTIEVWRVTHTQKAAFDRDNYENFVREQTDAEVRKLTSSNPYDKFADEALNEEITQRCSMNEMSDALKRTGRTPGLCRNKSA